MAKIFDKTGKYYYVAGDVDRLTRNFDSAIENYDRALGMQYNKYQTFSRRAGIYTEMGDYEKAIADYMEVLKIQPDDLLTHNRLAFVYYGAKKFDEAIVSIKKVIESRKEQPFLALDYEFLGRVYRTIGRQKEAAENFEKAIGVLNSISDEEFSALIKDVKIEDLKKDIGLKLALALSKSGQINNALAQVKKIISKYPKDAESYCTLSGIYNAADRFSDAIKAANDGLKIQSNNDFCMYNLGKAYYMNGNLAQAKNVFQQFLDLAKNFVDPAYDNMRLYAQNALAKIK